MTSAFTTPATTAGGTVPTTSTVPAPAGVAVTPGIGPTTPTPGPAKVGRPRKKYAKRASESFWLELRMMYETEDYSQRDLAEFARTHGHSITQPSIARRAAAENWVKGTIREDLRKKALAELRAKSGEQIAGMLEQHDTQARALIGETLMHLKRANEIRRAPPATGGNPDYLIPAQILQLLSMTLGKAQQMQSWANGWDHKRGRPFRDGSEDDKQPDELRISVLSEEEERIIRAKKEEETEE